MACLGDWGQSPVSSGSARVYVIACLITAVCLAYCEYRPLFSRSGMLVPAVAGGQAEDRGGDDGRAATDVRPGAPASPEGVRSFAACPGRRGRRVAGGRVAVAAWPGVPQAGSGRGARGRVAPGAPLTRPTAWSSPVRRAGAEDPDDGRGGCRSRSAAW